MSRPMNEGLVFGLIGDPVNHSLSPAMHRAAFAALGISARYELRRVPTDAPGEVDGEMRKLAALGGGNVTVPHKAAAADSLDEASDTVRSLGACNCFWESSPGVLAGENTDVPGILQVLQMREVGRERALVLGAGGAAAAVCLALSELGVSSIVVSNRTTGRARDLAGRLARAGVAVDVLEEAPVGSWDVAINATSLGLRVTDPLPLGFDRCTPEWVLDLVYSGQPTRWTVAAEQAGLSWIDGREVLLAQGAACYEFWLGIEAPVGVMRRALFGDGG
jgi:shikimate dehydrogenase